MSEARYYDGRAARAQKVRLAVFGGQLLVTADSGTIDRWPLEQVEIDSFGGEHRLTRRDTPAQILTSAGEIAESIGRLRKKLPVRRGSRRPQWLALAGLVVAAVIAVGLFFRVGLPAVAGAIARELPLASEKRIGEEARRQVAGILSHGGPLRYCASGAGDAALYRIVNTLIAAQAPRLPLEVYVLESPLVNAFALPGGTIVVLSGLIDFAEHPNEIAAVLAHEIGHSDRRHPVANAIQRSAGALMVGVLMGDVTGISTTVMLGQAVVSAGYTREAEAEADAQMLTVMRVAGLTTAPAARFFTRLAQKEQAEAPSGLLSLLSTHPASADRAARLREAAPQGRDVLGAADWNALKSICAARAPLPPPRQMR
jgi:Zn-dependent protease with chaperone function